MNEVIRIFPEGREEPEPRPDLIHAAMVDAATTLIAWEELTYDVLLFQLMRRGHSSTSAVGAISEHENNGRLERVEAFIPNGTDDPDGLELVRETQRLSEWLEAELPKQVRSRGDQKCIVQLRGLDEEPLVFGEQVPKLRRPCYEVIQALVNAGPDGLHKDDLESVKGDARKYLRDLRKSSTLWRLAILMPGKHFRNGYRIRFL